MPKGRRPNFGWRSGVERCCGDFHADAQTECGENQPESTDPADSRARWCVLLKTVPNMTVIRKAGLTAIRLFRGLGGSRLAITADDHHLFGGCGGVWIRRRQYVILKIDEVIITKARSRDARPGLVAGSVQFVRQTPLYQATLKFDGNLTAGSAERLMHWGLTAGWKYGYVRLNWWITARKITAMAMATRFIRPISATAKIYKSASRRMKTTIEDKL